jgi:chromate transporter
MSPLAPGTLLGTFTRIGLLSFGGPAGQIAVMHRILVEEKRWIGEQRFLHALNVCMLLPGPEAQQLATYCGWLLGGTWGGVLAGALFVLPGCLLLLALSIAYAAWGSTAWMGLAFAGLKPAVIALVLAALVRVGRRALRSRAQALVAIAAFAVLTVAHAPFPAVVAGAALVGLLAARWRPTWFPIAGHDGVVSGVAPLIADADLHQEPATARRTVTVAATWTALWLGPLAVVAWAWGGDHIFTRLGVFLSQTALVTFGGAYAVLPYVRQHAVDQGWITPIHLVDGLGMAETTPGPLILVLQFIAFLAAWRQPGGLHPALAGTIASAIAIWATFMPSYLFICTGAPWVERLRRHAGMAAALAAITAAVVGVIASLALWFAVHVCFSGVGDRSWHGLHWWAVDPRSVDPLACGLAIAAAVALIRFRLGLAWVLPGSLALGAAGRLLLG